MKTKIIQWFFIGLLVFWVLNLILAYSLEKVSNTGVKYEMVLVNDRIDGLIRRSCFDCHSNQLKKPWYSYLPIISVFIAKHIREGRAEVNFDHWESMSVSEQNHILEECLEEIEEKEMPINSYLLMHPQAKVLPQEISALKNYLQKLGISSDRFSHEDNDRD